MPIPNGTTSVAELKDSLEVLTFDLYGTVVDMQIHRIMHVANHAFDCIGAQAQGMRGAYGIAEARSKILESGFWPNILVGILPQIT